RGVAAAFFLTSAFIGAGIAAIAGGAIVDFFRTSTSIVGWRAALVAAGLPGIVGALYLQAFAGSGVIQPATGKGRSDAGLAVVLLLGSLSAVVLQMRAPAIWSVPLCVMTALAIASWWVSRLRNHDFPAYLATVGQQPFRYLIAAF